MARGYGERDMGNDEGFLMTRTMAMTTSFNPLSAQHSLSFQSLSQLRV